MRLITMMLAALLWLALWCCPVLALLAVVLLVNGLLFGGPALVTHWPQILVSALIPAALIGGYLTERVRREFGLLNLYARLLRSPELGRRHESA
jgi:hypothetical protein